ncbi:MAG: hypothetical protein ABH868_00920 [bacterium]
MATIQKRDVEKALASLRKFGGKMKSVAKVIEKDAIYGTKVGQIKFKMIALEGSKLNKLREVGKVAYSLYSRKKIRDAALSKQCKQLENIDKSLKKLKAEITKLTTQFKKR